MAIYNIPIRHIPIILKWLRIEYKKFVNTIPDKHHIYKWGVKSGYILHLKYIYKRLSSLKDCGKNIDEKPNRFILSTKLRRKSIFACIQNENIGKPINSAPHHWTLSKMKELNVIL